MATRFLAVGSSHLNSLKLSEGYVRENYGIEIDFSFSSTESWLATPVVLSEGSLKFSQDPQEIYQKLAPVPSFVRQLPSNMPLASYDVIIVGQVGMNHVASFLHNNRTPDARTQLWRNPVSWDLFNEIIDPVQGRFPPHRLTSWNKQAHVSEFSFDVRIPLSIIKSAAPDSLLLYTGLHPTYPIEVSQAERSVRRDALSEYWNIMRSICSKHGFIFIEPPHQTLDESGIFTRLEYSVNAQARDPHVNAEFGKLAWDKIMLVPEVLSITSAARSR